MTPRVSDHDDGERFFNPSLAKVGESLQLPR